MKLRPVFILFMLLAARIGATTFYVNPANPSPVAPYTNWPTAATSIQDAIDAATNGDLVLVTNGVYDTGGWTLSGTLTNRVVIDKAIAVQSVNGPAVTVIQGYQIPAGQTNYEDEVRCVYLTNNAVLNGFTVTGGGTGGNNSGGGVYCPSTNAFLTNCVLTGNVCDSKISFDGGGAVCGGTLSNCTLSNNVASNYAVAGGAAFLSVLDSCLISSNSASTGGGAGECTLNYCTVAGNVAPSFGSSSIGGGTFMCTANYCLITGNLCVGSGGGDGWSVLNFCILSNNVCFSSDPSGSGGEGGGSYEAVPNGSYTPCLNNCLVISNYCYGSGGGVYCVDPAIRMTNCTMVGNTATNQGSGVIQGGGVYSGTLDNCIVYGNYVPLAFFGPNYFNSTLNDCWTNDPRFVNPAAGDFHLQSTSPCINAGDNADVSVTNDLDGNPRIVGGTVDIGAYEYQTPASVISYAWLEQYGLPTDGSADYTDSDGTGMNNWQKWIAGLNPTNPASILAMTGSAVGTNFTGVEVTWQSVNTRTYYLQRNTNLITPAGFISIQSNIVGQAGTTSVTDSTAIYGGPYFYRIGIQ